MRVVNPDTLAEARNRSHCEWCGEPAYWGLQAAHVIARGMGGGRQLDIPQNLASLCNRCHFESHANRTPSEDDLLRVVVVRERWVSPGADEPLIVAVAEVLRETIWRLIGVDKDGWRPK